MISSHRAVFAAFFLFFSLAASAAEPPLEGRQAGAYRLGAGDEIVIRAPEAEEISSDPLRIGPSGELTLPLAGRIHVAGLTSTELEIELRRRLSDYYLDPRPTVEISGFRSQPVSVIGAVRKPGVHQLEGGKSLVEMLSLAGGAREDAGSMVTITRRMENGPLPLPQAQTDPSGRFSVAEVSLPDLLEGRDPAANIEILPRDVVSVPRTQMVYVIGDVIKAGGFPMPERQGVSVLEALALAGGMTRTAGKKKARILRSGQGEGGRIEIAVNLKEVLAGRAEDPKLESEDILFIPKSGGKTAMLRGVEAAIAIGTGMLIWGVVR